MPRANSCAKYRPRNFLPPLRSVFRSGAAEELVHVSHDLFSGSDVLPHLLRAYLFCFVDSLLLMLSASRQHLSVIFHRSLFQLNGSARALCSQVPRSASSVTGLCIVPWDESSDGASLLCSEACAVSFTAFLAPQVPAIVDATVPA